MENIGGIFVVLICGLIVAIFMAMLEFLWSLRHSEQTEVGSGLSLMLQEVCTLMSVRSSSTAVRSTIEKPIKKWDGSGIDEGRGSRYECCRQ